MIKSVILGLVVMTGIALTMTGCKSMCGMKGDDMASAQHPTGCTCAVCAMK